MCFIWLEGGCWTALRVHVVWMQAVVRVSLWTTNPWATVLACTAFSVHGPSTTKPGSVYISPPLRLSFMHVLLFRVGTSMVVVGKKDNYYSASICLVYFQLLSHRGGETYSRSLKQGSLQPSWPLQHLFTHVKIASCGHSEVFLFWVVYLFIPLSLSVKIKISQWQLLSKVTSASERQSATCMACTLIVVGTARVGAEPWCWLITRVDTGTGGAHRPFSVK